MERGGGSDAHQGNVELQTSPPSPGLKPVGLSDDVVEELLRVTLSLAVEGSPLSLSLSSDYCSRLLQPEPYDPGRACGGVPGYPLFKHLARAIRRCIDSGSFSRVESTNVPCIPLDETVKLKVSEWENLILDKGSELSNMLKSVDFELHVQEPFFSQLLAGMKTVEGRCAVGNYKLIAAGSLILFNKCLLLEVQHVNHYSSFSEMLQVENLAQVLPEVKTISDGVQIYRQFYTEDKEMSNGILAISVAKPTVQPYDILVELLSVTDKDLVVASLTVSYFLGITTVSNGGYYGIASLLGMTHTIGTVPDALPPPRSFLITSSAKPTRPTVTGCSLTDAARALAKHVNRSSDGWWGVLCGSDFNKNRLAIEVIQRMLNNCSWMNVHLIQPYGSVFEIRVPEGFGARWSQNGLKLIGFLEPYTEEGFSKGWKH